MNQRRPGSRALSTFLTVMGVIIIFIGLAILFDWYPFNDFNAVKTITLWTNLSLGVTEITVAWLLREQASQ